uniref:Uncharacterized protein n=1 Tax=Salvator merianae TaxID=96440 RepID=A0A8D0E0Z8_SALMN
MSCIEIYPGDGSVFRSEGSFWGKYFTRYCIQKRTRHREETMYSVSSLPPDTPGSSYSVWAIISEAIRILQHNLGNMLSLTHNYNICCWKMAVSKTPNILPIPVAEKIIPNVGRFFAYSDGKVHAIFNDGIALNMMWDFSPCSGKSQVSLIRCWFKLTSPEGAYQLLEMDHPGLYERYFSVFLIPLQNCLFISLISHISSKELKIAHNVFLSSILFSQQSCEVI